MRSRSPWVIYAGAIAITRSGLPLPPTIFSGAAIRRLPVGGTYVFEPIPIPEDPCGPDGPQLRMECEMNYNMRWNEVSCSCEPMFCRFGNCELQY